MAGDRYDARWQVSPRRPDGSRGVRGPHLGPLQITPIRVMLAVALVGSLAYLVFAITVRDASQIPMLASGAAVLGIVFAALAVGGAIETYRAGSGPDGRRAILLALAGGIAAIIAAGCFSAAIVLALVWSA
jgi:hypothetical protein